MALASSTGAGVGATGAGVGATGATSHPSEATPFSSNQLGLHVTLVHPLATAALHSLQVPYGTAAHPTSHPSFGSLLVSNLLAAQVAAVHVSLSEHALQVPPPT